MTFALPAINKRWIRAITIAGDMRIRGFTIMELLLVLMLVSLLASIAVPMVTNSIQRARESTLKESLFVLRKAIDDYYADNGKYPENLQVLVTKHYIRKIPADPVTESDTSWVLVKEKKGEGNVIDIHSSSSQKTRDGTPYESL